MGGPYIGWRAGIRGTASISGVGVHPVESSASQELGSQGRGQHLGGRACPAWKAVPRELRTGASGQDPGVGVVHREDRSVSQELGARDSGREPGRATASSSRGRAAAALLRVPEGREGGGLASPASVAIAGLAGRPGHPLSVPREDPRRAPLPAAPSHAPAAGQ